METTETPEVGLYSRFNYDDIFNRVVIAGLLDLLNNRIQYEQIFQDDVVETVTVPSMYDFGSSDERFAQDNYTFFGNNCFGGHTINGKFDMMPRCTIQYTGSRIDSGNITNRFVKGKYTKNENGKIVTYESFLYSIPITMNFSCTLWCANIDEAFKIEQSLREVFYKNKTYNVIYKGMRLSCCAGFPEEGTLEKTVSYSFDAERQMKLTFTLAVECYQPVFDETTKIDAEKRIEHIGYDVFHTGTTMKRSDLKVDIKFDDFDSNVVYLSGTNVYLSWKSSSNISNVSTVKLSYIDENGNETTIDNIENSGEYAWNIPEYLSNFEQPNITFFEGDSYRVDREPIIKIIPSSKDLITEESFVVLDEGSIISLNDQIQMMIDYVDEKGKLKSSNNYYLNIVDGHISKERPVILGAGMEPLKYTKPYKMRKLSLKIAYSLDDNVCDKIDNVLII